MHRRADRLWRCRRRYPHPRAHPRRPARSSVAEGVRTPAPAHRVAASSRFQASAAGPPVARHVRGREEPLEPRRRDSPGARRHAVVAAIHPHGAAFRLRVARRPASISAGPSRDSAHVARRGGDPRRGRAHRRPNAAGGGVPRGRERVAPSRVDHGDWHVRDDRGSREQERHRDRIRQITTAAPIAHGDRLRIGAIVLTVHRPGAADSTRTVPAQASSASRSSG